MKPTDMARYGVFLKKVQNKKSESERKLKKMGPQNRNHASKMNVQLNYVLFVNTAYVFVNL